MSNTQSNLKFQLKRQYTKFAFTLAEVLIALAVIGIVAAVTIPTLVQSYKKRVVETRLAKFYSAINQAIQLSEIENGDKKNWDAIASCSKDEEGNVDMSKPNPFAWYEKYLKKYLQVSKVEYNTDFVCHVRLFFNDGSVASMASASWSFYPDAKYYYSNMSDKQVKQKVGKTHFTFGFYPNSSNKYHYNKGVEPYAGGWDGTVEKLKSSTSVGCRTDATNEAAYCTKLIQLNGWKIPDDYPFKF